MTGLQPTHSAPPGREATDQLAGLVVDTLASYRLTKLMRDDRITERFRDALHQRFGPPDHSKVSYLLSCPWCMSMYFGLVLAVAHRRRPEVAALVSRGLAVSALTGLLSRKADGAG